LSIGDIHLKKETFTHPLYQYGSEPCIRISTKVKDQIFFHNILFKFGLFRKLKQMIRHPHYGWRQESPWGVSSHVVLSQSRTQRDN